MRALLKEKGERATKARIAILQIFEKKGKPLSALDVCKDLKKRGEFKNVNESTVFRTLSKLHTSGILEKVDLRRESAYFELASDHHHHIVCTECNEIEDFKEKEVEKLLKRIVEKSLKFKNVNEHSFELFGVCKICQ